MVLKSQTPIQAATSKGTYYTYRASWVGYHVNHIREMLFILNDIKKRDYARWENEVESLRYFIGQLNICKPDPKREQRQLAIEYHEELKAGRTPKFPYTNEWLEKVRNEKIIKDSNSKRELTENLPDDWRDDIFQIAYDKNSKHILAIAVMICSGCRPKELENGVNVKLAEEAGVIEFSISCAKRKGEAVEIRQFSINDTSLAFRYLYSQLLFNQGELQLRDIKYKAASTEVGRLSQLLNLEIEPVSPYCFRHAFSGDLHAAELNREQIAKCLGHGTDETQIYYSQSTKHSSGRFRIGEIQSTEPVKMKTSIRINKLRQQMQESATGIISIK
ncbi:MAG: hypothetical protein methR_P2749 [Methyloprofundus sp.]|nr:MAG: hypothetical protein methR_P2749 [Methyloprofundus sp.]